MKKILTLLFIVGIAQMSFAQYYSYPTPSPKVMSVPSRSLYNQTNPNTTYQSGYFRDNGTYVQPHQKTMPNSTNWDNYSTQGNYNPYNYSSGTKAPDYSSGALNYGSGKTIYEGPKGGQYYINSNGNKTYVPKRSTSLIYSPY